MRSAGLPYVQSHLIHHPHSATFLRRFRALVTTVRKRKLSCRRGGSNERRSSKGTYKRFKRVAFTAASFD